MTSEVPKILKEYLLTREGREKLAASMIAPVRCGGTEYIDDKLHYRLGGWLVPQTVLDDSRLANGGDPWPGIRAYQATHEPYVSRKRGRRA